MRSGGQQQAQASIVRRLPAPVKCNSLSCKVSHLPFWHRKLEGPTTMENVICVNTWEECVAKLNKIRRENRNENPGTWFRGQANAEWKLQNTLERRVEKQIGFLDYYRLVLKIKPEIETVSDAVWEMPSDQDLSKWAKTFDHTHGNVQAYEYLAYLRHNGFPSPLLDWSYSPYVAAYFAFASASHAEAAIFVYAETPNGIKGSSSDEPVIRALGPYVRTHRRHFLQQSRYTVCGEYSTDDGWKFVPHQTAFENARRNHITQNQQDVLWKIVVPTSERTKVLATLDQFNLNAFSLFGSVESHMETLAFREIDQKSLGQK